MAVVIVFITSPSARELVGLTAARTTSRKRNTTTLNSQIPIIRYIIFYQEIIMFLPIDLFGLYILFSHFRPRDVLMGICLLFFSLVMRTFARA